MLSSSKYRACALLTVAGVFFCAAVSHAGLFDRLKAKPRRTATVASTAISATRRAQSPVSEPTWQQPSGTVSSTPWYSEPAPAGTAYSGVEYCCGPEDKHGKYTKRCREKCDQTFYPPVPPYCFPCYGYNPTCWRRMQECYVCPREPQAAPPAPRTSKRPAPKVESPPPAAPADLKPPEPLDDPSALRLRTKASRLAAARSEKEIPPTATRSRWTSYTEALPEEKEEEIPETPADTLEEMVEAEDEATLETPSEDEATIDATVLSDDTVAEEELEAVEEEEEAPAE